MFKGPQIDILDLHVKAFRFFTSSTLLQIFLYSMLVCSKSFYLQHFKVSKFQMKSVAVFSDHSLLEIDNNFFQSIKSLLDYLRRRRNGFDLFCKALKAANQSFLADVLLKTKESIPEVGRKDYCSKFYFFCAPFF